MRDGRERAGKRCAIDQIPYTVQSATVGSKPHRVHPFWAEKSSPDGPPVAIRYFVALGGIRVDVDCHVMRLPGVRSAFLET